MKNNLTYNEDVFCIHCGTSGVFEDGYVSGTQHNGYEVSHTNYYCVACDQQFSDHCNFMVHREEVENTPFVSWKEANPSWCLECDKFCVMACAGNTEVHDMKECQNKIFWTQTKQM